jgi:cytochrome c6
MKKIISLTVVAAVVATGTLLAADAKVIYDKECTKCHGADGKGDTKMGKKLGAKDYTDPKVQAAVTDDAAFKAIKEGLKDKEGKTLMKPTEGVSDADMKAVVAYMRTFKK